MATDLITYLRRYKPSLTREETAVITGVSAATLTRRLRAGFEAGEVIKAARAVGAPPVEALIEVGYLEASDVLSDSEVPALGRLGDQELLEELLRRNAERSGRDLASVHAFRPLADGPLSPRVLAAMDDYEGEDLVREMEGHEEMP